MPPSCELRRAPSSALLAHSKASCVPAKGEACAALQYECVQRSQCTWPHGRHTESLASLCLTPITASQVLRRFHDLVLACRTLTVPDAPELPLDAPACAGEAGEASCMCGAKAVLRLMETSVPDAALRMVQRTRSERLRSECRQLRRAGAAAQQAAQGWPRPPDAPGASSSAPLCLSPLPARPPTAAAWAAMCAGAAAPGCEASALNALASVDATEELRNEWSTQGASRREAVAAMLARAWGWRAQMEAGEGSSCSCSCCAGGDSGGSSTACDTGMFDDAPWSPAHGGDSGDSSSAGGSTDCGTDMLDANPWSPARGGDGDDSSSGGSSSAWGLPGLFGEDPRSPACGSSSCSGSSGGSSSTWGLHGLFYEVPRVPAGGSCDGDISSGGSSTCGLPALINDELSSPAEGEGKGSSSGSWSGPGAGLASPGVGDHSLAGSEVHQGGDLCCGQVGSPGAADSNSREPVLRTLSNFFGSSTAGSDCDSCSCADCCSSEEHDADGRSVCSESAAAECSALPGLPGASQLRPTAAGPCSAGLEGAEATPAHCSPACDSTRPAAACARLADLACGALRARDGAAWLAAWVLALLAGSDAAASPSASAEAVAFSLWPLLWAAGAAGSSACAMRCVGAAAALASAPVLAAAPPLARTVAALMAAEGLLGLALWAPGTSGMCFRSLAPCEAAGGAASDASGAAGLSAKMMAHGVPLTRVLCVALQKSRPYQLFRSPAAALGELCAALFVHAAGFEVIDGGVRRLVPAPGERRAAAGPAATPAEALAESLAAFDGRELPGGAVLLAQEAPLRVRVWSYCMPGFGCLLA